MWGNGKLRVRPHSCWKKQHASITKSWAFFPSYPLGLELWNWASRMMRALISSHKTGFCIIGSLNEFFTIEWINRNQKGRKITTCCKSWLSVVKLSVLFVVVRGASYPYSVYFNLDNYCRGSYEYSCLHYLAITLGSSSASICSY